jgi:hypothetical protein
MRLRRRMDDTSHAHAHAHAIFIKSSAHLQAAKSQFAQAIWKPYLGCRYDSTTWGVTQGGVHISCSQGSEY